MSPSPHNKPRPDFSRPLTPSDLKGRRPRKEPFKKPPLRLMPTTLWEYPSQHYGDAIQGDKNYQGATPSWVIWQVLKRYTKEGDLVVDPMCGSGTTIDVARDLNRRALGYDLAPRRPDIFRADARSIPLEDSKVDCVFIDPPYSTHINYSDDPKCIGKLSAGGRDAGRAYYTAMAEVLAECHRILKPGRHLALYVSDSFEKSQGFMPIGFELFRMMCDRLTPVDIICVVRQNAKLQQGNWRKAAEEGNFFLRGFNYLFIMQKPAAQNPRDQGGQKPRRPPADRGGPRRRNR